MQFLCNLNGLWERKTENNKEYYKQLVDEIKEKNLFYKLNELKGLKGCNNKLCKCDVLKFLQANMKPKFVKTDKFCVIAPIITRPKKCVVFDLDGCIIIKANGDDPMKPEQTSGNFVFLHGVIDTMFNYLNQNKQIVLITNQLYLNEHKINDLLRINEFFCNSLLIFIADNHNEYRKPNLGFINLLKKDFEIEFYCGDAVGNSDFIPYKWSDTDSRLAINANIPFKTPMSVFGTNFYSVTPHEQLIIMMGIPGSGKTSIAKRLENENVIRYSSDENANNLKAKKRVLDISRHLVENRKVIVDACHMSNEKRQFWIDLAMSLKVSYVILWCVRNGRPFNDLREKPINSRAYSKIVKTFEFPRGNFIVVN